MFGEVCFLIVLWFIVRGVLGLGRDSGYGFLGCTSKPGGMLGSWIWVFGGC